jgi:hypothetical protein
VPEVFNRASSAFVSGFPLKDCGNDRSKLNLFMQRLGIKQDADVIFKTIDKDEKVHLHVIPKKDMLVF